MKELSGLSFSRCAFFHGKSCYVMLYQLVDLIELRCCFAMGMGGGAEAVGSSYDGHTMRFWKI